MVAVAAALLVFFFFGLAWISLPGPNEDEMLFLVGSFSGHGLPFPGSIRVFKHDIPTMLLPYLGATKGLLWRLVFVVWPPSIYSARVPTLLLAGLSLLLFYAWARRYYSPGVAATAVALAAADPSYIYTARLDLGFVVLHRLLAPIGLLLAARWIERTDESGQPLAGPASESPQQNPVSGAQAETAAAAAPAVAPAAPPAAVPATARALAWIAACGFCFGLGLWDKSSFAWFLIALGITLVALFPRDVLRRLKPAPVVVLALALFIGAFPLVRYNLSKQSGKTYTSVHLSLQPSEIADKLDKFRFTLDGRFIYGWVAGWAFDPVQAEARADAPGKFLALLSRLGPSQGTFLPWALLLSVVIACVAKGKRRLILFPLLVTAVMWVQVFPLKEGGGPHHYAIAYPFPHLAVAAAAGWVFGRLRGALRLLPVAVVAAVLVTMIGWDARTLWEFRETGGAWNWSDATYDVARYVNRRQPNKLVCMDWGFSYPLLLLTQNRVKQQDLFADVAFSPPAEHPKQVQRMIPVLIEPNNLYLFHYGGYQCFPAVREVFGEALRQIGMKEKVVATFKQRNGDDVALLSEVVPGSADDSLQDADRAPRQSDAFSLSIEPREVVPGGRYVVECRELAGKQIDLLYQHALRTAIADHFTRLDSSGKALIDVPLTVPRGEVRVVGVREAATQTWHPVRATVTVK